MASTVLVVLLNFWLDQQGRADLNSTTSDLSPIGQNLFPAGILSQAQRHSRVVEQVSSMLATEVFRIVNVIVAVLVPK